MRLTGERTLPGIGHENYWFRRHEVVYQWVRRQLTATPGARVLDAGCGEGYGAELLRPHVRTLTALDYDETTVAHVRQRYPGVPVVRGNLVQLPYASDAFDVLVSLQTIEHLWDQEAFVAECARVVRPGGRILLATPNRLTFPPGNICHTREFVAAELLEVLRAEFGTVELLGLWHGERIDDWERDNGSLVDAQLAEPPEHWAPALTAFVASLTAEDFVLRPGELDTSLDLLAIATPATAG
ncbi:class I SAM-dependent methyltransferase [Flindersiella endophytica]